MPLAVFPSTIDALIASKQSQRQQQLQPSLDFSDEKVREALKSRTLVEFNRRNARAGGREEKKQVPSINAGTHFSFIANYVDPFTPSSQSQPSPSPALFVDDDVEEERRWKLLQERNASLRTKQHQREERKESQPPSQSQSSTHYDWRWLLGQSDKLVSYDEYGQPLSIGAYQLASSLLTLLSSNATDGQLQSELIDLVGVEGFELIEKLLGNRAQLKSIRKQDMVDSLSASFDTASTANRPVLHSSASRVAPPVLLGVSVTSERQKALDKARRREDRRMARHSAKDNSEEAVVKQKQIDAAILDEQNEMLAQWRSVNLDNLKASALPAGTKRTQHKGYEEVFVPPNVPGPINESELIPITAFDAFARPAFPPSMKALNRIQSKCFDSVYHHNHNVLVCAPTGAGKTNIAMMAVLREIGQHIKNGILQKNLFKMIYVAPMKALAQEVQETFQRRLAPLGIVVKELTGDSQLTKKEIEECQLIVTTPEKWDVLTRKSGDGSIHSLVKLLIIDEVHLLHEERGPVIEILVARTLRLVEQRQEMCRIVGLSATLPNYKDVAMFLGVNSNTGLFHFDSSYRPVPLTQRFIGVQESNREKRLALMNEICYRKVVASVKNNHQVMIFVHSRRETVKTAKTMIDIAKDCNELELFAATEGNDFYQAEKKMKHSRNSELMDLFASGFGVHHAGMPRGERGMVEKLFTQGLIKVLVCTATLAWGVNLPSHTVIIKGTSIYDATKGGYVDVGMLDIMQIFGRAGRPQFDTSGEGIIITEKHETMIHYLALLNQAMPIESQFIAALPEHLNAEVILGTVTNMQEAITWLGYTYLYIRMMKNPLHYGINYDEVATDSTLIQKRQSLIADTVKVLMACRMMKCDLKSGEFYSTDVGRVASHYYLHHSSIEIYNSKLTPSMKDELLFDLLSQSKEFSQLKVRDEEINELEKLAKRYCPINILGGIESVNGKANLLLQSYISNALIDTPTLISDSYFITQSAGRIARALFEMTLKRGLAYLAQRFLTLAKEIDRRIWDFQSPLRQFMPYLKLDTISRIEDRNLSVEAMIEMTPSEIGAIIRHSKIGHDVLQCLSMLPWLDIETDVQPITHTVLKLTLTITPSFHWFDRYHGHAENFYMWVEDSDNAAIYHSEQFLVTKTQSSQSQRLVFTIPIHQPVPSQYYVRWVSERWLGSESVIPISFQHLLLPSMEEIHTPLLDLHPLPKTALHHPLAESLYRFSHFNPIQTQVFHSVYHSDENILLGAPTSSGKTVVAELAILRMLATQPSAKAVYIAPLKALARERIEDWTRSTSLTGKLGVNIIELTGDTAPDIKALSNAQLIITTPEKWDGVSRQWATKSYVKQVSLIIIDEIHLLGSERGAVLEMIVSRLRFISSHTDKNIRVIGLSTALANARDLGDWLGIEPSGLFNFPPSVRPVPLDVHISGFPGRAYCPRMSTMNRPCYAAILTHSPAKPVLIFVASRRQTRLTALDLISFSASDGNPRKFLHMSEDQLLDVLDSITDPHLRHCLSFGIGMHHAGLSHSDRKIVESLYLDLKIQVLVCTATLAWGVNFPAHLVICKGTEYFDARLGRYVDMPITDVLQMMGRAGRPQFDTQGVAVILVHEPKKNFYLNFLHSPFPVESQLIANNSLINHLNAEIANGTVTNLHDACDWLTWTFLFRRLLVNPNYYGLDDPSSEGLNKFLIGLINDNLRRLADSACIVWEGTTVTSTNIGRIASFYYLDYRTIETMIRGMTHQSSLVELLTLLSNASEFDELPVRHNEDKMNQSLAQSVRYPVSKAQVLSSPHTKAFIIYQCLFSHQSFPISDYYTDSKLVLDQSVRILQSMIDFSAEHGWLDTTISIVTLMQMIVQSRWHDDSTLVNVPHCGTDRVIAALSGKGVHHLPQLMAMNDKDRRQALRLSGVTDSQYSDVVQYLNRMPVIEMKLTVSSVRKTSTTTITKNNQSELLAKMKSIGSITDALSDSGIVEKDSTDDIDGISLPEDDTDSAGDSVSSDGFVHLSVLLARTNSDTSTTILSPSFTRPHSECWFLLVGREDISELILVKRINNLRMNLRMELKFPAPESGEHHYTVYLMSDAYLGLDQQYSVKIVSNVSQPMELPLPDVRMPSLTGDDEVTELRSSKRREWVDRVRKGEVSNVDSQPNQSQSSNGASGNVGSKGKSSWVDSIQYDSEGSDDNDPAR